VTAQRTVVCILPAACQTSQAMAPVPDIEHWPAVAINPACTVNPHPRALAAQVGASQRLGHPSRSAQRRGSLESLLQRREAQ
jgi:hypothetical protein